MYLGLDLGTSGVKAVLVDEWHEVVAQATAPLSVSRPHPLWSEQDPADWWQAAGEAVARLKAEQGGALSGVRAIGLSGQMHGATLLDDGDRVLRPAILWNDGRSGPDCAEFERRVPHQRRITGNLAMPGFTAPKLLWVARNEPELFARVARVLLPKDYLRLCLTGDHASDLSDSAGTLWLDVARRAWSEELVAATGLRMSAMPTLFEGSQAAGALRAEVAAAWGLPAGIPVAAGAGDNAAAAVGVGAVPPGAGFLSLGTSGVLFVSGAAFAPNPDRGVHAFCHCLPGRWHQMSVILSAASALTWASRLTGAVDEAALLAAAETAAPDAVPLFLPYLSGERTPHNDPHAQGVVFGLGHDSGRAELGRAVLDGVALAFADGQDVLLEAGAAIDTLSLVGGGSRSLLWARLLAAALGRTLLRHEGGEVGPAFGAARLARLAATGEPAEALCTRPPIADVIEPEPDLAEYFARRRPRFQALYRDLKPQFAARAAEDE